MFGNQLMILSCNSVCREHYPQPPFIAVATQLQPRTIHLVIYRHVFIYIYTREFSIDIDVFFVSTDSAHSSYPAQVSWRIWQRKQNNFKKGPVLQHWMKCVGNSGMPSWTKMATEQFSARAGHFGSSILWSFKTHGLVWALFMKSGLVWALF